jgi:hypothetical protein
MVQLTALVFDNYQVSLEIRKLKYVFSIADIKVCFYLSKSKGQIVF